MMRWKHLIVGLALTVVGVVGCKQQCFLTECDYEHYRQVGLISRLECDPKMSIEPATMPAPPPATVLDPERKPRYLSLAEAIAIALEQGRVGDQDPLGTTLTSLINIGIPAASETIRVLALDPAVSATDIEGSLAKFDALWTTAMTWTSTDEPGNGLNQFQTGNSAQFQSSLLKPLATGGVGGITFSTQYQRLSNSPIAGIVNPAYTPRLQFQFEQPLLQGYGVEINQLRATHPGSVLTPFPTGGRVPGILITRLRYDEQRAEFERRVHLMLRNVETAYWNLYDSYWTLYSREQAMRQAHEAWKINKARFEAGRTSIQDFAQTRQQFEQFRAQRLQALGSGTVNDGVLERERILRFLLGMPVEDGSRLVPVDAPTLTPYQPDWATAVNEALALRPELVIARNDLKFQQLNLINVKNLLLPDLRFTSTYALNGIGKSLEGTVSNAFRSLASDRFTDWTLGLRLNYNLGYRDAHAQLRAARLNLARSYQVLQEQETKAQMALEVDYRHVFEFYELIQIQRAQREAAAVQLQARFTEFQAGRGTLDILLESQRVWAEALRLEFDAITQYNNAIVGFEFSKGTIMQFDNVVISEGPLPHCAQVRAVEHERERSKAIVLHERANPVISARCDLEKGCFGIPELPTNEAPTLPQVFEGQPPAPTVTEPIPEPRKLNPQDAAPEGSGKASPPQMPPGIDTVGFSAPSLPPPPATSSATAYQPPAPKPNDAKPESSSKASPPQTPPAGHGTDVLVVPSMSPHPAATAFQPAPMLKPTKPNDAKPETSSKANPAQKLPGGGVTGSTAAPAAPAFHPAPVLRPTKPNDVKAEISSKTNPSQKSLVDGVTGSRTVPAAPAFQPAPKDAKLESSNKARPAQTSSAEGVPGFIVPYQPPESTMPAASYQPPPPPKATKSNVVKPETGSKVNLPQKPPLDGVPGFIVPCQAPQSATPAAATYQPAPAPKVTKPNDIKPDSSNKARPVQTSPADGVPGFIVPYEPPQSTAPAAATYQSSPTPKPTQAKGAKLEPLQNPPAGSVPGFIIRSESLQATTQAPAPSQPLPASKLTNPKDAKAENSSKAIPLQKAPAGGAPGFIILSQPSQAAASATEVYPLTKPSESSSKAVPLQKTPAGGVPGFIILSPPSQAAASTAGVDKPRLATQTIALPTVPEADNSYLSPNPYSPTGYPLSPKRP